MVIQKSNNNSFNINDNNYEDLRFPFIGRNIDVTSGRIDYDFDECTVDFQTNARYPNEPIGIIAQMPHGKKFATVLKPHLHWIQQENNMPNWMIEYRWYNNGDTVPSFTQVKYSSNVFTYSSGDLSQITTFPDIPILADESVSSICDIRFFRDSNNTSTLFTGADPYTTEAKAKELDLHFVQNSLGSDGEFSKSY